jgi:hypothetical protein
MDLRLVSPLLQSLMWNPLVYCLLAMVALEFDSHQSHQRQLQPPHQQDLPESPALVRGDSSWTLPKFHQSWKKLIQYLIIDYEAKYCYYDPVPRCCPH